MKKVTNMSNGTEDQTSPQADQKATRRESTAGAILSEPQSSLTLTSYATGDLNHGNNQNCFG